MQNKMHSDEACPSNSIGFTIRMREKEQFWPRSESCYVILECWKTSRENEIFGSRKANNNKREM